MKSKIKIGISSCLIGNRVRYDGRDKKEPTIIESLGDIFDFIPVCPEMEAGMKSPREPVRLVQVQKNLRVIGVTSGKDWTDSILEICQRRVNQILDDHLFGYILKSGSPSCGLEKVPIYGLTNDKDISEVSIVSHEGIGLFASAIKNKFPTLPVSDEIWLRERNNRDSFVSAVERYAKFSKS